MFAARPLPEAEQWENSPAQIATHKSVIPLAISNQARHVDSMCIHLCAWGNVAVNEVKPRRDYCWLKTISKPPLVGLSAGEFLDGGPFRGVSLQHKTTQTTNHPHNNIVPPHTTYRAPYCTQDCTMQINFPPLLRAQLACSPGTPSAQAPALALPGRRPVTHPLAPPSRRPPAECTRQHQCNSPAALAATHTAAAEVTDASHCPLTHACLHAQEQSQPDMSLQRWECTAGRLRRSHDIARSNACDSVQPSQSRHLPRTFRSAAPSAGERKCCASSEKSKKPWPCAAAAWRTAASAASTAAGTVQRRAESRCASRPATTRLPVAGSCQTVQCRFSP